MAWLERTHDQDVHQDHNAETQNQQRQLLDFQVVSTLARVGFGVHGVIQFAIRWPRGQWLDRGWHGGNVPKVCQTHRTRERLLPSAVSLRAQPPKGNR